MRRLTPAVYAAIFFVIFDSLVYYGVYLQRNGEFAPVTLSAPAPEVTWKAFDGSEHHLKDMEGHPVVLHFWASWCMPCREEFPKLLKTAAANPDIMFLLISSDEKRDKAQQFIKMIPDLSDIKVTPNVLYAWDPKKEITYDQFFTARYPETILIDSTLHMRRKIPGPVDWDNEVTHKIIRELRVGK